MTPVEAVARAIKDARALPRTKPVARLSDVDRRAARAAIAALAENVSEGMAIAGLQSLPWGRSYPAMADSVFAAMLAAALKG